MRRVEVALAPHLRSPGTGRWSGLDHAFDAITKSAALAALAKFGLLDQGNGADLLAHLFRRTNFGYGRDGMKAPAPQTRTLRWSGPATGGDGGVDQFGDGPAPLSGPV